MEKLKRWIGKYWWVILAGVGAVLGFILRGVFRVKPEPDTPTFTQRARDEVDRLDLEIEIEKAKVEAKSDAQKAELDSIIQIEDRKKKRERLAEFLEGLN